MVGTIIPRNQVQKITTMAEQGTATDATPIYTTPAGKRAIITLIYVPINIGASATVTLVAGGVGIQGLVAADFTAGKAFTQTFQLEAGKEFHFHGNVADNATINWSYQIQETST